jgi:hypothetical protein
MQRRRKYIPTANEPIAKGTPTPTPTFDAMLKLDNLEFEFDVGFAGFGVMAPLVLGSGGGPVVLEGSRMLFRVSFVHGVS